LLPDTVQHDEFGAKADEFGAQADQGGAKADEFGAKADYLKERLPFGFVGAFFCLQQTT
jgi:hypothetical protein